MFYRLHFIIFGIIFFLFLILSKPSSLVYAAACPAELADGTVDANYTFASADTYDCSAYDITINAGVTLTFTSSISGSGTSATGYGTTLNVKSLNIVNTGAVSANGKGFTGGLTQGADGNGPGAGVSDSANGHHGGGGAYGGYGGYGSSATLDAGGAPNGSFSAPISLGSGGGSAYTGGDGGTGGGAIKLVVTNTITIEGSITANGTAGTSASGFDPGGGAGGSVFITAATIAGAGSIAANGGDGGTDATKSGGKGSGGRIYLSYTSAKTFSGTITASKATNGATNTEENGTVLVVDSTNNDLYINNTQTWRASSSLEGPTHTYRNVIADNNSTWTLLSDTSTELGHTFTVTDFEVKSGSTVTTNGGGFAGGTGSASGGTNGSKPTGCSSGGTAAADGQTGAGGGGYGGLGSTGQVAGGSTCGSFVTPAFLGSGGGGSDAVGATGGNGGGLITITASGTTTLSGTLSANGSDGQVISNSQKGGGGSGGGLLITTATLAGAGSVTANGGNSGGTGAGGGGGGRISLKYSSSNTFSGTVAATVGTGGTLGENGTVVVIDTTNNDLYINTSQTWRPQGTLEGTSHTYRNITVQNSSTWTMYGYNTTNSDGYGFVFTVTNFTLGSGSSITGTGLGYAGSTSTGSGTGGGGQGGSGKNGGGGGYGGAGGAGASSGGAAGSTYGSSTIPVDLGSGGGGGNIGADTGGAGGGAIKIVATGTVTITGNITMNGNTGLTAGAGFGGGGGSGGSINLIGSTVTGGGTVTANGGNGVVVGAGCGGGGRIAVVSTTYGLSGTVTASKGTSCNGGADGTVNLMGAPAVSALAQYQSDGSTSISTGGTSSTTSVVLKMTMTDSDSSDTLTPYVEVQQIGTSFTNSGTAGTSVAYSGSGVTGSVTVTGLTDLATYHWQAKVCDSTSNCTAWSSYGGNAESATDFSILTNQTPSDPTSLGPSTLVDGSYSNDTTPTLTFTISDPDTSDSVKYQIIIDDSADFLSAIVNYTSDFAAEPYSGSFTVGQAAGSGTYTTGSAGQTLSDGNYYWKVRATDDSAASSSYTTANSGAIAFKIDATSPTTPGTPSTTTPTLDTTPTWSWTASTDGGSGLASTPYTLQWSQDSSFVSGVSSSTSTTNSFTHSSALTDGIWYFRVKAVDITGNESNYSSSGSVAVDTTAPLSFELQNPGDNAYTNNERPRFRWRATSDATTSLAKYSLTIDNGDTGDFTINDIPISGTETIENDKYNIFYEGFSDSDTTNNYISVETKSSREWGDDQNDGKLKEGIRNWKVETHDQVENNRTESRTLFVDFTGPTVSLIKLNETSVIANGLYTTLDANPTIYGRITDFLSGNLAVSSGPDKAVVNIEKKNILSVYEPHLSATVSLTTSYWANNDQVITNNILQTSDKYSPFSYLVSQNLSKGEYKIGLSGRDKAGNTGSEIQFFVKIGVSDFAEIISPIGTTEDQEIIQEIVEVVKEITPAVAVPVQRSIGDATTVMSRIYWGFIEGVKSWIGLDGSYTKLFLAIYKPFLSTGQNLLSGLINGIQYSWSSLVQSGDAVLAFVVNSIFEINSYIRSTSVQLADAIKNFSVTVEKQTIESKRLSDQLRNNLMTFIFEGLASGINLFANTVNVLVFETGKISLGMVDGVWAQTNLYSNLSQLVFETGKTIHGIADGIIYEINLISYFGQSFFDKWTAFNIYTTTKLVAIVVDVGTSGIRTTTDTIDMFAAGTLQISRGLVSGVTNNTNLLLKIGDQASKFIINLASGPYKKLVAIGEILFDQTPLAITNVKIVEIGKDYAIVEWQTNHYSKNNKINYGETLSYGQSVIDNNLDKIHTVRLTNLIPGAKYVFEVMSQGTTYVYDAHYEFTTLQK